MGIGAATTITSGWAAKVFLVDKPRLLCAFLASTESNFRDSHVYKWLNNIESIFNQLVFFGSWFLGAYFVFLDDATWTSISKANYLLVKHARGCEAGPGTVKETCERRANRTENNTSLFCIVRIMSLDQILLGSPSIMGFFMPPAAKVNIKIPEVQLVFKELQAYPKARVLVRWCFGGTKGVYCLKTLSAFVIFEYK